VKSYCQNRTVLYITHDISVLSHFDKVLKLSEINDN
jgi:ABC-type transport system involved in cytochrome bd biosynthesis fused ATPase/permease subunit